MSEFDTFKSELELTKRRTWCLMIFWAFICAAASFIEHRYWPRFNVGRRPIQPLLSGPAQITLLALIIALAAYLRSIRNNALEFRDKIRHGKAEGYPWHPSEFIYAKAMVMHLDQIANSMTVAGPFFIWLSILVAFRIVYEAYARWAGYDPQFSDRLFIADTVISLWLFAGILALGILHFKARRKDEQLRIEARKGEEQALVYWEQLKKRSHPCAFIQRQPDPEEDDDEQASEELLL